MSIASGRRGSDSTKKMVYLAILTAIVFLLQYISLFMRFTAFSLTFVLVPIVIDVALCGKWAGAWLGFVFGLAVFATGDAAAFLAFDVFGTIVTVMLKGILAGLGAGLVYHFSRGLGENVAVILSAFCAPVINTGIFVLGCYVFFYDDIAVLAGTGNIFPFIVTAFVGINFLIELGTNILLSPCIIRLLRIKKKA